MVWITVFIKCQAIKSVVYIKYDQKKIKVQCIQQILL